MPMEEIMEKRAVEWRREGNYLKKVAGGRDKV